MEIVVIVHGAYHLFFELFRLLDLFFKHLLLLLLFEFPLLVGQSLLLGLHGCTFTACLTVETLFDFFSSFFLDLELLPE